MTLPVNIWLRTAIETNQKEDLNSLFRSNKKMFLKTNVVYIYQQKIVRDFNGPIYPLHMAYEIHKLLANTFDTETIFAKSKTKNI